MFHCFAHPTRIILLIVAVLSSIGVSLAADPTAAPESGSGYVIVTEKIPFAQCDLHK